MGYIREPEGIDFIVDSRPLQKWEKEQISEVIAHYKKTGVIKKFTPSKKLKKEKV